MAPDVAFCRSVGQPSAGRAAPGGAKGRLVGCVRWARSDAHPRRLGYSQSVAAARRWAVSDQIGGGPPGRKAPGGSQRIPTGGGSTRRAGFWGVVLALELVDLAFSLDNVVAAVGLSRELWVVMAGVFLGIVTMRVAAGAFSSLIARYPVLEATAYLLILMIGLELLVEDLFHIRLGDVVKFAISLGTVLLSLVYGQQPRLQQMGRRWMWLKRSLGYVALLFDYVLTPISWIVWCIVTFLRAVGARRRQGRAAPASSIRGVERPRSIDSDRPHTP